MAGQEGGNLSSKRIVFVGKDPAGAKGIMAIMRKVMGQSMENIASLDLLTDAGSWLDKSGDCGGIRKTSVVSGSALAGYACGIDILVSSACSNMPDGSNLGRDIAMAMPRGKTVILVTDTWDGAQTKTDTWAKPECRPDYIVVNDVIGMERTLDACRPWLSAYQFQMLGWPSLDQLAGYDVAHHRKIVREQLGISYNEKVIFFAGQLQNTSATLEILVEALNIMGVGRKLALLARNHPRMFTDTRWESEKVSWNNALVKLTGARLVNAQHIKEMTDVIAASDIITSLNSNALVDAAALSCKEVMAIQPPELYLEPGNYPLWELGCCTRPRNQSEANNVLLMALSTGLGLVKRQKKVFRLDGQNTTRVADFICSLL